MKKRSLLVSTKSAVMVKRALPVHGMSQQCWLSHHCRLEIQTDSVAEDNTVGLSYQPTVMVRPTQPA